MKQLDIIIEKADNNYSAYIKGIDGVATAGDTIDDIRSNMHQAIDAFIDECKALNCECPIKDGYTLNFKMDVASFLKFYDGIISKAGLERLTGIHQKQLWHYASGNRNPRKEQAEKIEDALHQLGRELLEIKLH